MSVKATYCLADIDKVEATLSVTMPIGDWKQLLEKLPRDYPGWQFANAIRSLIHKATTYHGDTGEYAP